MSKLELGLIISGIALAFVVFPTITVGVLTASAIVYLNKENKK